MPLTIDLVFTCDIVKPRQHSIGLELSHGIKLFHRHLALPVIDCQILKTSAPSLPSINPCFRKFMTTPGMDIM